MAEQEINKVADLIPFLDSLQELWEGEVRFRPVLRLSAALYKENADSVIYTKRTGDKAQEIELAEKAATARAFNLIFNLPQAVKMLKESIQQREEAKKKMEESNSLPLGKQLGSIRDNETEKEIHTTYAQTLQRQNQQTTQASEGGN